MKAPASAPKSPENQHQLSLTSPLEEKLICFIRQPAQSVITSTDASICTANVLSRVFISYSILIVINFTSILGFQVYVQIFHRFSLLFTCPSLALITYQYAFQFSLPSIMIPVRKPHKRTSHSEISKPLEKRKATTAKGKRILAKKEPQPIEGIKLVLFLNTTTASQLIKQALSDFNSLRKPNSVYLRQKKELHPFDQDEHLLALAERTNCGLFMTGYDSKKRPQTLLLGRVFDQNILDMFELKIIHYVPMRSTNLPTASACPILLFNGELFTQDEQYIRLKNTLIDFFHGGESIPKVYFNPHTDHHGPEYVMSFTALPGGKLLCHTDKIILEQSDTNNIPKVTLIPIGPHMACNIMRTKFAGESVQKQAYKKAKNIVPKKTKNVSRDALGDKYGRIYNPKQDFTQLVTRHVKALHVPKKEE